MADRTEIDARAEEAERRFNEERQAIIAAYDAQERLIAAAPDLLAALEAALFAIESAIHLQGNRDLIPYAEQAAAAIARAR